MLSCVDSGDPRALTMAQKGEAGRALSLAAWASALGAIVGFVVLIGLIPVVRAIILNLTPVEFFMLCPLVVSIVPLSVRGNMVKGFAGVHKNLGKKGGDGIELLSNF